MWWYYDQYRISRRLNILIDDDFPQIAPFLSTENFIAQPVEKPIFKFSPYVVGNIIYIQKCKEVLCRLDHLIQTNRLHLHTCLILQAGSQTTMRLASKTKLRSDWNTAIEIPFCLFITENGYCSRTLDYEDLDKQAEWLLIFEQVLLPLNHVDEKYIPIIAPQQTSKIVKVALKQSRLNKKKMQQREKLESVKLSQSTLSA